MLRLKLIGSNTICRYVLESILDLSFYTCFFNFIYFVPYYLWVNWDFVFIQFDPPLKVKNWGTVILLTKNSFKEAINVRNVTVVCIIVRRLLISVHKWQSSGMAATHEYWSQHDAHLGYLPIFHGLNLIIFS